MQLLMEELALDVPKFTELNLAEDPAWWSTLDTQYRFRSAPSSSWYQGVEDPTILVQKPAPTFLGGLVGTLTGVIFSSDVPSPEEALKSVTESPTGRHMARARRNTKSTQDTHLGLVAGELLEVLRIVVPEDGSKSWCFVVVVGESQDKEIRLGYVWEEEIYYI